LKKLRHSVLRTRASQRFTMKRQTRLKAAQRRVYWIAMVALKYTTKKSIVLRKKQKKILNEK
jgi:hypothetical protein